MPGLTYGPVRMTDVVTKSYVQETVYNGPDFIHVKHTLTGTATVHPYLLDNALEGALYPSGVDAAAKIKLAFLQPRQAITFEVGLIPFVAMAPSGDVQNGPEPLFFEVVQVQGAKTLLANFGISFYTITDNDLGAPPITSNRWVMSHSYDDQYRLTITTKGMATFRRDALTLYGTSADDYRSWLMIPIPPGYRRTLGPITMSQDGLSVEYQTVDTRNLMDALSPILAHLSMKTTVVTGVPGEAEIIRSVGVGAAAAFGQVAQQAAFNPAGALMALPLNIAQGAFNVALGLYDALPKTTVRVEVVGYGAPTSPAWAIYLATLQVIKAKFLPLDQGNESIPLISLLGASTQLAAEMDHDKRICVLVWKYELAPIESVALLDDNGILNPDLVLDAATPDEFSPDALSDAAANFLVYEEMGDETGPVYGSTQAYNLAKGPGQDGTGPAQGLFGYIGSDVLEVLVCQALQPARPLGNTINPPQAGDVTGFPVLLHPEGRS